MLSEKEKTQNKQKTSFLNFEFIHWKEKGDTIFYAIKGMLKKRNIPAV